uniref:Metalloendopeptidase n=1 Tax=Parastrongyloides trichosuri TaxID=131310 RepID=A0A0N4Z4X6_PARTI
MECKVFTFILIAFIFNYCGSLQIKEVSGSSQLNIRRKRGFAVPSKYQWNSNKKYFIHNNVHYYTIYRAISNIEKYTCLKFTQVYGEEEADISFIWGSNCFSESISFFNLDATKRIHLHYQCYRDIVHVQRLIHNVLGATPEVNRYDRDMYVNIYRQNIKNDSLIFFKKEKQNISTTFNLGYDYGSFTHYYSKAFSKNDKATILAKEYSKFYAKLVNHKRNATFNDFKLLYLQYCLKKSCRKSKIKCKFNGYLNPNNCTKCICPPGRSGNTCEKEQSSSKGCGTLQLKAEKFNQTLRLYDNIECHYLITSDDGYKIEIYIENMRFPFSEKCSSSYGLEIKYQKDKGATGLVLCGLHSRIKVLSKSRQVVLNYYSFRDNEYADIKFRQTKKQN